MTVTLSAPRNILSGTSITVTWSGIESPTTLDWIGLFNKGELNPSSKSELIAWAYVNSGTSTPGAEAPASGSVVDPIFAPLGDYEIRLFYNDLFEELAAVPISVVETLQEGLPFISPSGEALYERLGPVMVYDEEYEFFGRFLCQALMAMFQELDRIVLDGPGHPGWCTILDPNVCPPKWLLWCAQLYGVGEYIPANSSVASTRQKILALANEKRGTLASMEGVAKPTLTGAQEMFVTEQANGHPYRIVIFTPPEQTPNEQLTREALISRKPAGVKLIYSAQNSPIWELATKKWQEVAESVKWATVESGQV